MKLETCTMWRLKNGKVNHSDKNCESERGAKCRNVKDGKVWNLNWYLETCTIWELEEGEIIFAIETILLRDVWESNTRDWNNPTERRVEYINFEKWKAENWKRDAENQNWKYRKRFWRIEKKREKWENPIRRNKTQRYVRSRKMGKFGILTETTKLSETARIRKDGKVGFWSKRGNEWLSTIPKCWKMEKSQIVENVNFDNLISENPIMENVNTADLMKKNIISKKLNRRKPDRWRPNSLKSNNRRADFGRLSKNLIVEN